jgi:hypothetical protein
VCELTIVRHTRYNLEKCHAEEKHESVVGVVGLSPGFYDAGEE